MQLKLQIFSLNDPGFYRAAGRFRAERNTSCVSGDGRQEASGQGRVAGWSDDDPPDPIVKTCGEQPCGAVSFGADALEFEA
jgi:hypothetical protein